MEKILSYQEIFQFFIDNYPEIGKNLTTDCTPSNPLGRDGVYNLMFDGHSVEIKGYMVYCPEFNIYAPKTKDTFTLIAKRYRRALNINSMIIGGSQDIDVSYIFEDGTNKLPDFSGYWFYDETSGRRKVFIANLATGDRFEIKIEGIFKLIVKDGVEHCVKSIDVGHTLIELSRHEEPKEPIKKKGYIPTLISKFIHGGR